MTQHPSWQRRHEAVLLYLLFDFNIFWLKARHPERWRDNVDPHCGSDILLH